MINKMLAFSYAEWRYNMKTIRNKLPTKIARL